MKNSVITILIVSAFCLSGALFFSGKPSSDNPVPTEFLIRKEKRKEFKLHRREYIEQMHRADPETDWREIDARTRRSKVQEKTRIRQEMRKNSLLGDQPQIRFGDRDLTGEWQERGSNNLSGRILTAEIDTINQLLYCASSGGNIWRSTLDGQNWQSLNDYFQITGIRMLRFINTDSGSRLLIGTGNKRFYYSDDDGYTIEESTGLNNLHNWGHIIRSVVKMDPGNTVYLLSEEWNYTTGQQITVLRKSVDLGTSFTSVSTLSSSMSGSFDIWTPRYSPGEVYLLNDDDLYLVAEDDNILPLVNLNAAGSGNCLLIGGVENGAPFLYARVADDIYFSGDGGMSWNWRSSAPSGTFTNNSFGCSNFNPQHVYIGNVELYRSTNGAASWTMINPWWEYYGQEDTKLHADIPEVRLFPDPSAGELVLISTDGGIYISTDYVQNVSNLSLSGLGVSQYYSTYTNRTAPHHVYAGSQDQGYQRSLADNGGIIDFEQVISGDYGHLVSGDGGESIWCDYPGFVLHYPDAAYNSNGWTWDFAGSGFLWLPPLTADPLDPDICYLAGGGTNGNHIIELEAGSWSIIATEQPYNFASQLSALAISPIDPDYRYTLTSDGTFYMSSDGGVNWLLSPGFSGPDSHYFYGASILASQIELGTVYIAGSGYSNPAVYISHNHGMTFTPITSGLPSTLVFELASTADENVIFAATEVGPYAYVVADNQWYDIAAASAPDQTYWSVDYIPELSTARFGTYGRGIWDFTLSDYYWITPGDINQDTIISVNDIILLINFILGNLEPTSENLVAADINDDGIMDILDILVMVNIILNG